MDKIECEINNSPEEICGNEKPIVGDATTENCERVHPNSFGQMENEPFFATNKSNVPFPDILEDSSFRGNKRSRATRKH